jgi:AAA-like domain
MSLRASEYGIQLLRNARVKKGWKIIDDWRPLLEASRILEPNKDWREPLPHEEIKDLKYKVTVATWRRFLGGNRIENERVFEVLCEILDLRQKDVCAVDGVVDIIRKEESVCINRILQPASFLRIKGPKYTGKTRMLDRVLKKVQDKLNISSNNRVRMVTIDFLTNFDSTVYESLDKFLKSLCQVIYDEVNIGSDFEEDWERLSAKDLAANYKATNYIADKLSDFSLILILEDIDRVFETTFALDFCDLIRGWHAKSKRSDIWKNLSIVIVHSTDVYAEMDINSSPLANIREVVVLDDFSDIDVQILAKQYNLYLSQELIHRLMLLVGGNPFLIDLALGKMADKSITIDRLFLSAATENGVYRDHLRKLWEIVSQRPHLRAALKTISIISNPLRIDPLLLYQLESLGLVKIDNNGHASFRYELYCQYFTQLLNMEDR